MFYTWIILVCLFVDIQAFILDSSDSCSSDFGCFHLRCDRGDNPVCLNSKCYCKRFHGACHSDNDCRYGYCEHQIFICDISSNHCACGGYSHHHTHPCMSHGDCAGVSCGPEHHKSQCYGGKCVCLETFYYRRCGTGHHDHQYVCPPNSCSLPYTAVCHNERCGCIVAPVNGGWSHFGHYGACSRTCGGGTQTRSRTCTHPAPKYGGHSCSGSSTQTASCNTNPCPVDGSWSVWGHWGTCTVTCGGGTHERVRPCSHPAPSHGGKDCVGPNKQTDHCNTGPCPIHGSWSAWGDWGRCNATCGVGTRERLRTCSHPAPSHGGKNCPGFKQEIALCLGDSCPVDGHWSAWGHWGQCSETCGQGTQERLRTCSNPAPSHGGANCAGSNKDTYSCHTRYCPVDGHWSAWGQWGHCTVSCGGGTQERHRTCTNPVPNHGGANCTGSPKVIQKCNEDLCPVDGSWSSWSSWGHCSQTCDGGTRERLRTCTNPAPSQGGSNCVGSNKVSQDCNNDSCPSETPGVSCPVCDIQMNCVWGRECSENYICMVRSYPHFNFTVHCTLREDCVFMKSTATKGEIYCCDDKNCLSDNLGLSVWSSWESWGNCSVACGNGTRERQRTCIKPFDDPGSPECDGSHKEIQQCNTDPCPIVSCPVCDGSISCVWNRNCPENNICMILSYPNFKTVTCSVRADCYVIKAASTSAMTYCCDDKQCINSALNL